MNKYYLSALLLAFSTHQAIAKDSVTVSDKFDVDQQVEIEINVPVGEFRLTTHDGNYIELDVEVEDDDEGWFSSADLDNVELTKRVGKRRVFLEIDEEDTEQHWHISVPQNASINLDMGVGEAVFNNVSRDIKADLGVGEVTVELSGDDYKKISAEVGVGEASINGFNDTNSSRALISEDAYWRGTGKYSVVVEVGVGEANIRRQ